MVRRCIQVLELMELTPLKNVLVGVPGMSKLSVEQRKRLTHQQVSEGCPPCMQALTW